MLRLLTLPLFVAACAALAGIVLVTVAEVVLRYAFDAPSRWAADSASYALCAAITLALPELTRRRGHVAITILSDNLPFANVRARALAAIGALTCGGAAWIALGETLRQAERGVMTQGASPIPKAFITGSVTLGLFGAALAFTALALSRRADDPG